MARSVRLLYQQNYRTHKMMESIKAQICKTADNMARSKGWSDLQMTTSKRLLNLDQIQNGVIYKTFEFTNCQICKIAVSIRLPDNKTMSKSTRQLDLRMGRSLKRFGGIYKIVRSINDQICKTAASKRIRDIKYGGIFKNWVDV